MRYNDIIILRITDFQNYFTFEEFWKSRKLFPIASKNRRFGWDSMDSKDKLLENSCIAIINEWLEGIRFTYLMDSQLFLYRIDGTCLGQLDSDVFSFLSSLKETVIESNLLPLCALYQLLPKLDKDDKRRLNALERDISYIKSSLSLASIDFSKPFVEFEEAGKTNVCPIRKVLGQPGINGHWVLMHNASTRHTVSIIDTNNRNTIFRVLQPLEDALVLFDKANNWIKEKVLEDGYVLSESKTWHVKMIPIKNDRRKLVYYETDKEGNILFDRVLSDDVITYSTDRLGCVFLVKDNFKPIRVYKHPHFDSDIIRLNIKKLLNDDEDIIDLSIIPSGLEIITSTRVLRINESI